MEYLIVMERGDGTKLYLDKEGAFGEKSLGYPMPWWMARVILRSCFSNRHKVNIEEAR